MKTLFHRHMDRRGFWVGGARWAVFFAMAGFATWQEAKRRRLAGDPNCIKLTACADCVEFARCTWPKARRSRS